METYLFMIVVGLIVAVFVYVKARKNDKAIVESIARISYLEKKGNEREFELNAIKAKLKKHSNAIEYLDAQIKKISDLESTVEKLTLISDKLAENLSRFTDETRKILVAHDRKLEALKNIIDAFKKKRFLYLPAQGETPEFVEMRPLPQKPAENITHEEKKDLSINVKEVIPVGDKPSK